MIVSTPRGAIHAEAKPRSWMGAYGPGLASNTVSGQTVTPTSSMASVAVFGGVSLIADYNGAMPLEIIDTRAALGRMVVSGAPMASMLRFQPNADQSGTDLWTMVFAQLILWGNVYLAKVKDDRGLVAELVPLHPECVTPYRNEYGDTVFRVRLYDGQSMVDTDYTRDAILHIKAKSISNPLVGESVIEHCRTTIGTHAAQVEYQARAYQDGMLIKGVLTSPERNLNPDAIDRVKAQWRSTYGGISNSHDVAVLHSGITFQPVSMKPDDAQFIETMKWSHTQVATMLKIPASRLNGEGSSLTYANQGQDDLFFDKQAAMPWRVLVESALNRDSDLFGAWSAWVPRFNADSALAADAETRARIADIRLRNGSISVNEYRASENEPSVVGGDVYAPIVGSQVAQAPVAGARSGERDVQAAQVHAHIHMPEEREQAAHGTSTSIPIQSARNPPTPKLTSHYLPR